MSYKVMFDQMTPGWTTDPERNLKYLKSIQSMLNAKLHNDGYLYLKDALDIMGLACPFDEGIGWWIEDVELPWKHDNFIDIGLYHESSKPNRDFVNGRITDCILDFNCTGNLNDYFLDKAIYIGGPELAQDFFDYPWLHRNLQPGGIEWER